MKQSICIIGGYNYYYPIKLFTSKRNLKEELVIWFTSSRWFIIIKWLTSIKVEKFWRVRR